MQDIVTKVENGKILIQLNVSIYEKEAIMLATNKMTEDCYVLVEPASSNQFNVYLEPQKNQSDDNVKDLAKRFCNEVLDMQIRLDIEKKYGNIRELIIKQAFSPIENIKDKIKI